LFALPLLSTMVVTVVVCTFAVLSFRLFVQGYQSTLGSVAGGASNAIVIMIMNILWKMVATKLTDWENHRLESEYTNNLIFKIFVFYFVNSYTSLYYMAFFKSKNHVFDSNNLIDGCNSSTSASGPIISNGCTDEVTIQLVTILAVNMFVGQANEVLIPWAKGKILLYLMMRKTHEERKEVPIWERDYKKAPFAGTFDEYSEMIIQYGYFSIFAAAFPLAPLMAVLNNIVEIRTDGFKLLTANPRPDYRGAQNIGTWYSILEVLGIVSVMTNVAQIGLSFEVIYDLTGYNQFETLGIIVIMEHVIIFLKYLIAFLVPDYPGWIVKRMALEEFIKDETIKSEKLKDYVKPTWKVQPHNDEEDEDFPQGTPTLDLKVEE